MEIPDLRPDTRLMTTLFKFHGIVSILIRPKMADLLNDDTL
jgi:hypothetical protein